MQFLALESSGVRPLPECVVDYGRRIGPLQGQDAGVPREICDCDPPVCRQQGGEPIPYDWDHRSVRDAVDQILRIDGEYHVVYDSASLVQEVSVPTAPRLEAGHVLGRDARQPLLDPVPLEGEETHVGDVEQARCSTAAEVLLLDGAVPDWEFEAVEIHHRGSCLQVLLKQGSPHRGIITHALGRYGRHIKKAETSIVNPRTARTNVDKRVPILYNQWLRRRASQSPRVVVGSSRSTRHPAQDV